MYCTFILNISFINTDFFKHSNNNNMEDKFCLKWHEFHSEVSQSFKLFRQEKHFFDVTLVSDDEVQIPAHKLVLSACSSFFKSILQTNAHDHPLLYLSGFNSKYLGYILDYMYNGEIEIYQEQLGSFLDLGQTLKIEGLETKREWTDNEESKESNDDSNHTNNVTEYSSPDKSVDFVNVTDDKSSIEKIIIDTQNEENVNLKIAELMVKERIYGHTTFSCKVCGKTCKRNGNMRTHILTHIQGLSYPCHLCGKTYNSKNSLHCHTYREHKSE